MQLLVKTATFGQTCGETSVPKISRCLLFASPPPPAPPPPPSLPPLPLGSGLKGRVCLKSEE